MLFQSDLGTELLGANFTIVKSIFAELFVFPELNSAFHSIITLGTFVGISWIASFDFGDHWSSTSPLVFLDSVFYSLVHFPTLVPSRVGEK